MLLRDAMEPLAVLVPHILRYYGCDLGRRGINTTTASPTAT